MKRIAIISGLLVITFIAGWMLAIWRVSPRGQLSRPAVNIEKKEETLTQPHHELLVYTSPPVEIPHGNGGTLNISASQIRLTISAEVIRPGIEQCDIVRFDKTITDEDGQTHSFSTFISAYDLWDSVSDGICCSENVYTQSWRFPEGTELIPIATDLKVWSDGRDPRLLGVYASPDKQPYLFAIQEKYFSATVDLFIQRGPPLKTGYQPSDKIVARVTIESPSYDDVTDQFELNHKTPLMVPIHRRLVLYSNYQRISVIDEETGPTWNNGDLPQSIEVKIAELGASPKQEGVRWIKQKE